MDKSQLRAIANSSGTVEYTTIDVDELAALRAENERLRAELEEATQYNNLFRKCMRRALLLWREKHPDVKLWPDAAKNFCWVCEENDRLRTALRPFCREGRSNTHLDGKWTVVWVRPSELTEARDVLGNECSA